MENKNCQKLTCMLSFCMGKILIITDSGEAPASALRHIRPNVQRFKLCAPLVPFVVKKVRSRADFRPPLKAL